MSVKNLVKNKNGIFYVKSNNFGLKLFTLKDLFWDIST